MHFELLLDTKILSEMTFYNTESVLVEYFYKQHFNHCDFLGKYYGGPEVP